MLRLLWHEIHAKTCQGLSRPVKTCQDLSRPVKTCQDLSRLEMQVATPVSKFVVPVLTKPNLTLPVRNMVFESRVDDRRVCHAVNLNAVNGQNGQSLATSERNIWDGVSHFWMILRGDTWGCENSGEGYLYFRVLLHFFVVAVIVVDIK